MASEKGPTVVYPTRTISISLENAWIFYWYMQIPGLWWENDFWTSTRNFIMGCWAKIWKPSNPAQSHC